MDSREQKVRVLITALEAEIESLTAQIEQKRTQQRRYQDALDVWMSLDVEGPVAQPVRPQAVLQITAHQRFAGRKFLDCVYEILRETGSQPTSYIHDALVAGGFESNSANFRSIVSNMLNEASKDNKLVKTGERLKATWDLPTRGSMRLTTFGARE